ncbi:hypothetical protein ACQ4PT_036456 [Festuca glaucescens]
MDNQGPIQDPRKGKEAMIEMSTEREKIPIIINMARARGVVRRRFLAVGIFLSLLAITSKNPADSMRRIWNIRGHLISNQLLDRRIGELICIDEKARGDICNKIIRTRALLPIDQPLRRWVSIVDEIIEEDDKEVLVDVHYEHLPTFCSRYGHIGHRDGECAHAIILKHRRYNPELRVPPTPSEDPRRYFLPEYTGQSRHQHQALLWRNRNVEAGRQGHANQLAFVSHVTSKVGSLSMREELVKNIAPAKIDNTNEDVIRNTMKKPKGTTLHSKQANSSSKLIINNAATSSSYEASYQLIIGGNEDQTTRADESTSNKKTFTNQNNAQGKDVAAGSPPLKRCN